MSIRSLQLLILFFSCLSSFAATTNNLDPELMKQIHKLNKSKPALETVITDKSIEKSVNDFGNSELPGLLKRVKDYKHQIAAEHGYDDNPEDTCYEKKNLGDINLYVFISSSVPEGTLKTYAADVRKISPAIMVLNGAIGGAGKIMPTVNLITRISCGKSISELKTDNECSMARTDINPYLFRTFGIDAVPAFVISDRSYSEVMLAASKGEKAPESSYMKMTGDTPLSYVLEHLKAAGSHDAAAMLEMLNQDGYYKCNTE